MVVFGGLGIHKLGAWQKGANVVTIRDLWVVFAGICCTCRNAHLDAVIHPKILNRGVTHYRGQKRWPRRLARVQSQNNSSRFLTVSNPRNLGQSAQVAGGSIVLDVTCVLCGWGSSSRTTAAAAAAEQTFLSVRSNAQTGTAIHGIKRLETASMEWVGRQHCLDQCAAPSQSVNLFSQVSLSTLTNSISFLRVWGNTCEHR